MADEEAERQRKLRLAQAQRARINQLSAAAQEEAGVPATPGNRLMGAVDYTDRLLGEVNEGLISFMPQNVKDRLHEWGVGSVPGREIEGPVGTGLRSVGMTLPFAIGAPAYGAATAPKVPQYTGMLRTFIDDIAKYAMANPKTYLTGETAAAFGAGVLGETAREADAGPGVQLAAEIGGSVLGGFATVGPRSFRAMREGFMKNIAPMTEEGGMIRASQQMQERAGGAQQAERYAQRLEEIPEGVTPAQWIGDERLMSQEARLLQDNPELSNQVKSELQEARIVAQEELRDSFGTPRTRQDWEKSVLERVSPEGAVIEPGMTDDMLDQAYRSFEPLYDAAKGQDISASGLKRSLSSSPYDESIIAADSERKAVEGWVNNQITAFEDDIVDGIIPSDSLLSLRSKVRDQRRLQSRRGNEERADLLGAVEQSITQRLEESLTPESQEILKAADSQYRKYKVVENAIFNAGDSNLSPEQLSQSIRMGGLTSQSRYARGVDEATQELRRLSLAGRSTEEVMGDPQRASLFVRDLGEIEKQAVQADFTNVLFNRAKDSSREATEGGLSLISGEKLLKDINDNAQVMRNLGMSSDDISRLKNIGQQVRTMEQKSPQAVANLFEDGPASILQLVAAIAGADSGQRMASGGIGSSLVLAQFMSNKARGTLARLTSDQAEKLMEDAVTDPKLYKALLTKSVVERDVKERARYLESWLLASAYNNAQTGEE